MAKKLNLESINIDNQDKATTAGEVFTAIERGNSTYQQQGTASLEEQKARASKLKTQGRKGCKAERINMAFTPENYSFINVMSRLKGETLTQFTNSIIEKYRLENEEVYLQAKELVDRMER